MNEDNEKKRLAEYISKHCKRISGKKELIAFYNGEYLSYKDAIKAHCFDCLGYCADYKVCDNTLCPLHNVYLRANNIKNFKKNK